MMEIEKINNCKKWFGFINQVRSIMNELGFSEVITPTLVPAGALEAELYPFQTQFQFGKKQHTLELPTSPEFHLKKLLALGWESLFEIKTCFRNEEWSEIHRPEFTMLEFYELSASSEALQKTVQRFLTQVLKHSEKPTPQIESTSIAGLFKKYLGVELTPESSLEELKAWAQAQNIRVDVTDDFNDVFFRIWLDKIEPHFDPETLLFVQDFPPSQAALAALSPEGWADRFEIYWKGFELGNAFFELQDAVKLKARYESENAKRVKAKKAPHPIDEELLVATAKLPECSGIAIGLERLFMAINDLKSISDFKIQDFNY